jgi:two-component system, OmpR family, phosphate regulon sensor histidine kinase PhoR
LVVTSDVQIVDYDGLADKMGVAAKARVTLIDSGGTVIGDSIWSPAELRNVPNHGTRPEILQLKDKANKQFIGRSKRYSVSAQEDLMYVALAAHQQGSGSYVRLSLPLSRVDKVIWTLRTFLLTAALVGLLVAFFLSGFASHMMANSLRRLLVSARALAEGKKMKNPILVDGKDELGSLSRTINRMGQTLRQQLDEMQSEKKHFNSVLNRMQVGVISLDEGDDIELINNFAKEWLGLADVELGQHKDVLKALPELYNVIEEVKENPTVVMEVTVEGVSQRKLQCQVLRQKNNDGVVMAIHDVTRLRHLERIRRDFVANVSHELRTPVSVILVNSEMLLDGAMEDPVMGKRFMNAINDNAQRLALLLNDLLDISKMEAEKMELEPQEFHIAEAVQKIVDSLEAKAAEKQHDITVDISQALRVFVDEKVFDQILTNYVDNAIKYTPEQGKILVMAQESDQRIRVAVSDNGPGIEEKHHQRIFERFYRVDKGRSKYMGGTGLGLAIVKHLARSSGGDVGVTRSETGGSLFWVSLPRADADNPS